MSAKKGPTHSGEILTEQFKGRFLAGDVRGRPVKALFDRIEDVIRPGRCIVRLEVIVQILQVTSRIVHKEFLE